MQPILCTDALHPPASSVLNTSAIVCDHHYATRTSVTPLAVKCTECRG